MNILRMAAVPLGVVIGVWTAALRNAPICPPATSSSCAFPWLILPTFAAWECALFGLGAAVLLVLVAEAFHRLTPR